MQKSFYLLFALLLVSGLTHAQKAFEMVSYVGKNGRQPIQLELADGYLMGSVIKLGTDKQTSRYLPEPASDGQLHFLPEKPTVPITRFEVAFTEGEKPAESIKVVFVMGKERKNLILKRISNKDKD